MQSASLISYVIREMSAQTNEQYFSFKCHSELMNCHHCCLFRFVFQLFFQPTVCVSLHCPFFSLPKIGPARLFKSDKCFSGSSYLKEHERSHTGIGGQRYGARMCYLI